MSKTALVKTKTSKNGLKTKVLRTTSLVGSGSIFHKTWGRDVEEEAGNGKIFVEVEAI